jgi:hypothetical protein
VEDRLTDHDRDRGGEVGPQAPEVLDRLVGRYGGRPIEEMRVRLPDLVGQLLRVGLGVVVDDRPGPGVEELLVDRNGGHREIPQHHGGVAVAVAGQMDRGVAHGPVGAGNRYGQVVELLHQPGVAFGHLR